MLIHHLDVGQGDAALIISPEGEVAMIDSGISCSKVVNYVLDQGVTRIDYHFATHYDDDHISCLDDLVPAKIALGACYDRGDEKEKKTQAWKDYLATCDGKRITPEEGDVIELSGGTKILVVALNRAREYG